MSDKLIVRDAEKIAALLAAIHDYDRAELGRLNLTAEALRKAAGALGWRWGWRKSARAWCDDFLEANGLK